MVRTKLLKGLSALLLISGLGIAEAQPAPPPAPAQPPVATPPARSPAGPGMDCQGMMGPHGMAPGMMGHPGMMMGPGMMGHGMGPGAGGMTGWGPLGQLNLNDKQRETIGRILDQHRRQQWEIYGRIGDQAGRLRDLYSQERWDADAIGKVYDQIFALYRQAIEQRIKSRNQIYDQLTKEQRDRARSMGTMDLLPG